MARKTLKRKRVRKSTVRKRRRLTKKSSHNAKLWKYVKKATKSEVKRCDALYPQNYSYTNTTVGVTAAWIYSGSRYLTQLVFFNTGVSDGNPSLNNSSSGVDGFVVGKCQMWKPFQLKLDDLAKGAQVNERIGDKIFLKYFNFKIAFEQWNTTRWEVEATLYLLAIDRSVSASYDNPSIFNALWFNVSPCFNCAYTTTDQATQDKWTDIWEMSYRNKRKRFLKGIRIKKLGSYRSTQYTTVVPNKWSYYSSSGGVNGFQVEGSTQYQYFFRPHPKSINKIVKINKELEWSVKDTPSGSTATPRIDNVKYYLICCCNSPKFVGGSPTEDAKMQASDLVCQVSVEAVYTDK